MPNYEKNTLRYENSKIYKIWSPKGDKIFISSTTKDYLSQRMTAHRIQYSQWTEGKVKDKAFELFDEYGIDNCHISLIEEYPCGSCDQLRTRKDFHVGVITCVNNNVTVCVQKKKCICGLQFKPSSESRHNKTKWHIRFTELHGNKE